MGRIILGKIRRRFTKYCIDKGIMSLGLIEGYIKDIRKQDADQDIFCNKHGRHRNPEGCIVCKEQKGFDNVEDIQRHNPPSHLYQEPGTYTWECPSCGRRITFTVPSVSC